MATKKAEKQEYNIGLEGKMDMVAMSIRAVTRNYKTSRCVLGTPGIGKSHTIMKELAAEQEYAKNHGRDLKYKKISGGVKDAISFYTMLCDNNAENMIIFLDDINTAITDKNCREILRVATENTPERVITYSTNQIVRGKTFYKPSMEFKSKIIISTNIPMGKIDGGILSRTSPIEIIATVPEIFEWVGKNLEEAPPTNIPIKWKNEVYNFLRDEIGVNKLRKFDFRVFEDCCMWFASCVQEENGKTMIDEVWKTYVSTMVV